MTTPIHRDGEKQIVRSTRGSRLPAARRRAIARSHPGPGGSPRSSRPSVSHPPRAHRPARGDRPARYGALGGLASAIGGRDVAWGEGRACPRARLGRRGPSSARSSGAGRARFSVVTSTPRPRSIRPGQGRDSEMTSAIRAIADSRGPLAALVAHSSEPPRGARPLRRPRGRRRRLVAPRPICDSGATLQRDPRVPAT